MLAARVVVCNFLAQCVSAFVGLDVCTGSSGMCTIWGMCTIGSGEKVGALGASAVAPHFMQEVSVEISVEVDFGASSTSGGSN